MAAIVPINVDLNKLFEAQLSYSFDPLKEAIEALLKNQELQNKALEDLAEEQKELSSLKGENQDLKDQLKAQNDRIDGLESKIEDHEKRIEKLENTAEDHEKRIDELEKKLEDAKTTYDYSQTIINGPVKGSRQSTPKEDIENELKHLSARLMDTQQTLNVLVQKRNDVVSTAQTTETVNSDDEDTRETLENQLQAIKTRLSRVEDTNKELKTALEKEEKSDEKDTSQSDDVDREIQELKEKIKQIEDKLKELRGQKSPTILASPEKEPQGDYTNFMYDLNERLETLENNHKTTETKLDDHAGRIEKLEKDSETHAEKISGNKQDIGEIKDTLPEKVDCETFDAEINYIKELLNQLGSDKKIDMSALPPPKAGGMSTKDANKLKELATKVPELEKLINEILERLGAAERDIGSQNKHLKKHDKDIEDLWKELAGKVNTSDLNSILDRLNRLEKDVENLTNHINSMSKGSGGPVIPVSNTDDKRLSNLEKKVEDLRNHVSSSLRDLEKTMGALNTEIKGLHKELGDQKNDLLKLMKKVNDLELKVDSLLKRKQPEGPVTLEGVDPSKLDDLRNELNELRNNFRNFRNEVSGTFDRFNEELDRKANKEDLEALKNLLKSRLDDLEKALSKTKNDLKRALRILNDKISKGDTSAAKEERDDAMFSKKPLQGISCASCEKNIVNLQGMPADYYNWKKMPQSKDRIPMMGQGFSRMLQSISNDYLAPPNSHTPMKTSYGGFKELDSHNSARSHSKRPSSSDRRNLHVEDIETDAASKMLPSIKDTSNR